LKALPLTTSLPAINDSLAFYDGFIKAALFFKKPGLKI